MDLKVSFAGAGIISIVLVASSMGALLMTQQTGPGLSATERQIVSAIDANVEGSLALLERIVNINSGTMNLAGVRQVGDVLRAEFDALGFETRWVEGAAFQRAGHLVAEHGGGGPRLLLIGHLDTVFELDSPSQRFERLPGNKARGPGIIDMKGGDVVMLYALKALASAGALAGMNVSVIMTGDEESVGEPRATSREALIQLARRSDIALGFENGPGDPRFAVISRRGFTGWTLRVKGTPAHSSQIFKPEVGAGAIFEAARILNAFREELSGDSLLSFNPGAIVGGTTIDHDDAASRGSAFGKTNVVAEHALVTGEVRAISKEQLETAKRKMMAIVDTHLPRTSGEIAFEDSYPPMAPSDGNRALLDIYARASRDVGAGDVTAADPRSAGAADISFAAQHVQMAIDGIGLMGTSDHTINETADLATLASQTRRAAITLHRLAATQP
jgi:glutamate carboxypeptidase